MPDFRTAGAPMPIPNSGGGRGNEREATVTTAAASSGASGGDSSSGMVVGSNRPFADSNNRNVSESDSFPESPYVNPFSPGQSHPWGNMNIPKSFSLNVANHADWSMDTLNLGDERDLAHRLD